MLFDCSRDCTHKAASHGHGQFGSGAFENINNHMKMHHFLDSWDKHGTPSVRRVLPTRYGAGPVVAQ